VGEDLWDAYDRMGLGFQQHAADGAYNAHYDRPAVLAALGPVTGRRVLDAACGPGLYLRELLERGAEIAAFDASPVMVSLARQRTAGRVRIDQAALGGPSPYSDGAFDLIVCALAIHYASDRGRLRRVLPRPAPRRVGCGIDPAPGDGLAAQRRLLLPDHPGDRHLAYP
jgi:SAM-dependent methyltransferase